MKLKAKSLIEAVDNIGSNFDDKIHGEAPVSYAGAVVNSQKKKQAVQKVFEDKAKQVKDLDNTEQSRNAHKVPKNDSLKKMRLSESLFEAYVESCSKDSAKDKRAEPKRNSRELEEAKKNSKQVSCGKALQKILKQVNTAKDEIALTSTVEDCFNKNDVPEDYAKQVLNNLKKKSKDAGIKYIYDIILAGQGLAVLDENLDNIQYLDEADKSAQKKDRYDVKYRENESSEWEHYSTIQTNDINKFMDKFAEDMDSDAASPHWMYDEDDLTVYDGYGQEYKFEKQTDLDEAYVKIDLAEFKPWSGAERTWYAIEDAGKMSSFEFMIEDMYPEGIDSGVLNDMLRFEGDWILQSLGIQDEDEDEALPVIDDILDWLSDHEQATQDFIKAFSGSYINDDGELVADDVSSEDAVDWIREHEQLSKDFDSYFEL